MTQATTIEFQVGDAIAEGVTAVRFAMTEALSSSYRITLDCLASSGAAPGGYAQKQCAVTVGAQGLRRTFAGKIVAVSFRGIIASTDDQPFWWQVTIVPRLDFLQYVRRSRVFATVAAATPATIIGEVLSGNDGSGASVSNPLTEDIDFNFSHVTNTYQSLAMSIQWQENDRAYACRLAEQAGIGFFFSVNSGSAQPFEVLNFFDANVAFQPLAYQVGSEAALYYRPVISASDDDPAVRSVQLTSTVRTTQAGVSIFDYRIASTAISGAESASSPYVTASAANASFASGFDQWFDQDAVELIETSADDKSNDKSWVDVLAQQRANEAAQEQVILEGASDCVLLAPGVTFTLVQDTGLLGTMPPDGILGQTYTVLSVTHAGAASVTGVEQLSDAAIAPGVYTNRFTAMPSSVPYEPKRTTPVPRIAGVIRAMVDPTPSTPGGQTPERARLDANGCYKLQFPFDQRLNATAANQPSQGQWSAPVRLLTMFGTPHGNLASVGFHLPLLPGTEVMVAFVGGHPDRPVIVGSAFDSQQLNVVTSNNATQGVLRTPSGIVMNVSDGAEPTNQ